MVGHTKQKSKIKNQNSVGKSTVLNALLGDKFSEVSLRRTTAGINFFRIYQNIKDSNKKTSTSTKDTVASINDDNEKTTTTTTTTNTTEAEEKEQDLETKSSSSSSSSSSVGEEWSIVVDNDDYENNNKTFKSSVETHNEIEQDNKLLRDAIVAVVAVAVAVDVDVDVDVDVCDSSPSQSCPNDGTTTTTGGGNDGNGDDGDVKNDTKDEEEEEKEQKQQVGEGGGVSEKVFHVQVDHHPIIGGNEKGKNNNNDGGMRDDTRLVLIDIPGINEAGSSSDSNNNNNNNNKYKDYVESNWDTFDCVICVLDAIQGVNTQEQIELLKFIKRNNDNLKKIPTIILGNKMDDLNDDDTQNLIEETRLKTIEIFGNDCYDCAQFKEEEEEDDNDNDNDNDALPSRSSAVFIPLSAKNAFMYRKAGNINLNELEDIKYRDVVNKIGYDEYGRKWSKMNIQQQIESVIEILSDPDEYNMRLAGTNFHTFLNVLTYYAGGNEAQKYLLSKQIDIELSRIANGSNKKSISESIYKVYKRCKAIDRTDETTNDLKDTFWNGFQD
jgi:GTP-binding protein EngB required for normal cell division